MKFPWSLSLGNWQYQNSLTEESFNLPVLLPCNYSSCLIEYDIEDVEYAFYLIEESILALYPLITNDLLEVHFFDFDFDFNRKFNRFSSLMDLDWFYGSFSDLEVLNHFDDIKNMMHYRHHKLLSYTTPTLNDYNRDNINTEKYQIILINLDSFANESSMIADNLAMFDALYTAGGYCIFYSNSELKHELKRRFKDRFPRLVITNQAIDFLDKLEHLKKMNALCDLTFNEMDVDGLTFKNTAVVSLNDDSYHWQIDFEDYYNYQEYINKFVDEELFWNLTVKQNTLSGFELFHKKFPSGRYHDVVIDKSNKLNKQQDVDNPSAYILINDSQIVLLIKSKISVGRIPDNDIVLDDTNVSRIHAFIERIKNKWYWIENNPTNPSLINGKRLYEKSTLSVNDVVICGSTKIELILKK